MSSDPRKELLRGAKRRATKRGVPFDLKPEDIHIPELCPALGIPLKKGEGKSHANSPTLDRIRPEVGYVKGNTVVLSDKANRIKSDATPEELEKVASFCRQLIA